MNPTYHKNVLLLLAEAGRKKFCKTLDFIAICSKVDGNVDAYQVDNKFLAVHTVDNSGELSIDFLSIQPPTMHGSKGMLEAMKNGFDEIGFDFKTKASKHLTGITSDDENANSRTRSGLWTWLKETCEKPLLAYWCTAHCSNLTSKVSSCRIEYLAH